MFSQFQDDQMILAIQKLRDFFDLNRLFELYRIFFKVLVRIQIFLHIQSGDNCSYWNLGQGLSSRKTPNILMIPSIQIESLPVRCID